MSIDLSDFKKQDIKSWKIAAEKALKGKPLSGLLWKVDEQITMQPFYTKDQVELTSSLSSNKKDNRWYIGETFNGDDPIGTNDLLLKALAFGLDSPLFFDLEDFDVALQSVRIDFLFPIFRGGAFSSYLKWLDDQKLDKAELNGAFIAFEADFDGIDISENIATLKKVGDQLPNYYHSHLTFSIDPDNLGKSIGRHLIQLSDLIYQLKSNDISVRIICEVETDSDFIKTVSVLRAIRLMIAQICEAYKVAQENILLDVYVHQIAQDVQLGMIGASSQAMAAVTAGIDRLTISCEAMNVQQEEEVTRRMTRNVHHLMKMESGLDKVVDPLSGSYTIENLTKQIAEQSWKIFQKG